MKKINFENIVAKFKEYNYTIVKNTVYNGVLTKMNMYDNEGFYYFINYRDFNSAIKRANFNGFRRFDSGNPHTVDNIKKWLNMNNKDFTYYSGEYINNSSNNLIFQCKICGEKFSAKWGNIHTGQGCSFCAGKRVGESNSLANLFPEIAKEWHPIKNKFLTPKDVTKGYDSKVWWKCKICGYDDWFVSPAVRTRKRSAGCPSCTGKVVTAWNNFAYFFPNLICEWDYEKNKNGPEDFTAHAKKNVFWICSFCKSRFQSPIHTRATSGMLGCSKCKQPKGESKIENFFIVNNNRISKYVSQFVFSDCKYKRPLEYDFAIWLKNGNFFLCEYQGHQHYEPVDFGNYGKEWAEKKFNENKTRDQIKRDYCKQNNIHLLEIPYWEFNNIEKILEETLTNLDAYQGLNLNQDLNLNINLNTNINLQGKEVYA